MAPAGGTAKSRVVPCGPQEDGPAWGPGVSGAAGGGTDVPRALIAHILPKPCTWSACVYAAIAWGGGAPWCLWARASDFPTGHSVEAEEAGGLGPGENVT
ncbi:hypothetical protein VULLAG_LOCUS13114 [Vulpes lagopus]